MTFPADSLDFDVDDYLATLKGKDSTQQRQLGECLGPVVQRIRAAVHRDGALLSDGEGRELTYDIPCIEEELSWEDLARQISVGREDEHLQILFALEGLCDNAVKREKLRKALLRSAFNRMKRFVPEDALDFVPPASAPGRLQDRSCLPEAFEPNQLLSHGIGVTEAK